MRIAVFLLLAGALAYAKPPKNPAFARHDALHFHLADQLQKLAEKEAFEAKPRIEKAIILFKNWKKGDPTTFGKDKEKIELVGKEIAIAVLEKWPNVQKHMAKVTEDDKRILDTLVPAMEARYGRGLDINKKERYDASRVLVDALTSEYLQIRITAIECLKKIYRNEGRFYRPDAPKKDRVDKQKKWKKFILKEYRGR